MIVVMMDPDPLKITLILHIQKGEVIELQRRPKNIQTSTIDLNPYTWVLTSTADWDGRRVFKMGSLHSFYVPCTI